MSTTTNRDVALKYANEGEGNRMIYEIQMGMVDRGADLKWLSQYEHEEEMCAVLLDLNRVPLHSPPPRPSECCPIRVRSLFAPLTGIDVQKLHVDDDVLVVEIRLSINQTNLTLEQVAAKMQKSHLDLLRLLIDDLKHSGAPDHTVDMLRSLENEQSKVEPEWFNSAENFASATSRALNKQQEVYEIIGKPTTWGLDEDCCFKDDPTTENVEERWKVTSKMRAVAQMAARLGERGFKSATSLLKMALDPRHLKVGKEDSPKDGGTEDDMSSGRSSGASYRQSVSSRPTSSIRQSVVSPSVQRRKTSLRESIRDKMDVAIFQSFITAGIEPSLEPSSPFFDRSQDAGIESPVGASRVWDTMRLAFYVLKEGAVQPWPALLVKSLAELPNDPAYLRAFLNLLQSTLTKSEYETPFKPGASVLFYTQTPESHPNGPSQAAATKAAPYKHEIPSRWERGRIHQIEMAPPEHGDGGGVATMSSIDVQVRGTEVVSGLQPKHVLSISTAGVGAILLEAARQGHARLLEHMLDASISPFYCDRHANTALIEGARKERADVCQLLIQKGLDPHLFNRFRENAYDVAVGKRHVPTLRAVAPSKSDLEVASDAASQDKGEKRDGLLVIVEKRDEADVIRELEAWKIRKQLAKLGVEESHDINVLTPGAERTALMIASRRGHLATVEKLLELGADVKKQAVTYSGNDPKKDPDRRGASAVTIAAEEGHVDVLRCARAHYVSYIEGRHATEALSFVA